MSKKKNCSIHQIGSMKIVGITQARTGSTRFPKKLLETIDGRSLLEIHIEKLKQSTMLNTIIIATTNKIEDDEVVQIAKDMKIKYFRGSENDVLDRYYKAATEVRPFGIARFTADCPLIDPVLIDEIIENFLDKKLDYYSNILEETYPDGQDIEVFTFTAIERAWKEAKILSDREHVTPFIKKNSTFMNGSMFTSESHKSDTNYQNVRLTVDEKIDLKVIKNIIQELGVNRGWETYAKYYLNNKLASLNKNIIRNEGYKTSITKDKKA